jgi:hypothetical protein
MNNNTRKELIAICKEMGIKGYSGKKKQDLIVLIATITPIFNTPIHTIHTDSYTECILKEQYALHKSYVSGRINTTKRAGVKVRLPSIPEDISENFVKFIIHKKLGDFTSRWDCKKGDLHSVKEGVQEIKCFTSCAPLSFTPTSDWDIIYFLDARNWLNNQFALYRIPLKRTSDEWKNIQISKTQTFGDQCSQGRRPRMSFENIQIQISTHCKKVYEGSFDEIFIPTSIVE